MDKEKTDKVKVLIVDDNINNIKAMKKVLSDLDVTIHTATSGVKALTKVIRHQYAVIFLDVNMPNMDGYEVAEYMSQNSELSNMPVVFVTAATDRGLNELKGYESGAIDFLIKPIVPEILISKTKIFVKLYEQQKSLQEMIQELNKLISKDVLTGLLNRHGFYQAFNKLLPASKRHASQFALLYFDLDNFKNINDTLGHDVGDKLLQIVSRRLEKNLRVSDYIGRLGGDEFGILSTDLKKLRDSTIIANKVFRALRKPIQIDVHNIKTTASMGIATYPFAGKSVHELFKAADIALYRAKAKNKNKFEYYSKQLNHSLKRNLEIERSIEDAIKTNDITLFYQPRIDLRTDKIIGFEALVRWDHKTLGRIEPIECIQIAEQSGMMVDLGDYLLETAFKHYSKWRKQMSLLTLSVNLSPYQLRHKSFLHGLKRLLWKYDINPKQIELELTESIFEGDYQELESILRESISLGIQFSIDDFGTGYSSLSRLKRLPINILKIDQSFIHDVVEDKDNQAIVKAIIALAEALDLHVVAEGVESKEQADFLLHNGCIEAQGFYYHRPLAAAKIEDLLKEQTQP